MPFCIRIGASSWFEGHNSSFLFNDECCNTSWIFSQVIKSRASSQTTENGNSIVKIRFLKCISTREISSSFAILCGFQLGHRNLISCSKNHTTGWKQVWNQVSSVAGQYLWIVYRRWYQCFANCLTLLTPLCGLTQLQSRRPIKISPFTETTVYWPPCWILVACFMTPTTLQFSYNDCSLWLNSILSSSFFHSASWCLP